MWQISRKKKLEKDDTKKEPDWITVNGVHIPIKPGQNKDDVVKNFLDNQKDKEPKKDTPKKDDKSKSKEPPQAKDVIKHKNADKLQNTLLKNTSDKDKEIPPISDYKTAKTENSSWLASNGKFINDPNLTDHYSYVKKHGNSVGVDSSRNGTEQIAQFMMNTGMIRFINTNDEIGVQITGNPSTSQLRTMRSFDDPEKPLEWEIRGTGKTWVNVVHGGLVGSGFKDLVKALKSTGQLSESICPDCGEACWKGYKQVGMKDKDGKQVPNCVPESKEFSFSENLDEHWLNIIQEVRFRAFTHTSSFVGNVRYDQDLQEMTIILNGKEYNFCNVPERKFEAFRGADSKGAYFNRNIRTLHDC